jgi:hypothetical protein
MKLVHLLAIAIVFQCSLGQAAVYTSTTTINQSFQTDFQPFSVLDHPSLNGSSFNSHLFWISSGVNSASFSTDTVADHGQVTGIQFKPIGLPGPATFSRNVSVQRLVVDVPADFPLPPVTHFETDVYRERIQFDTPTNVTPALANSTVNPLFPIQFVSPWFQMTNELTLAPITFALQGTYEAIGPTSTKTIPFSVTYEAFDGLNSEQRTGVEGGANFGNGFRAELSRDMSLNFRTQSPLVINEEVDGMQFRMRFPETVFVRLVRGEPIPEPSSAMLLGMASFALVARSRRRR